MIQPQVCYVTGCAGHQRRQADPPTMPDPPNSADDDGSRDAVQPTGIPGLDGEPSRTIVLVLILLAIAVVIRS